MRSETDEGGEVRWPWFARGVKPAWPAIWIVSSKIRTLWSECGRSCCERAFVLALTADEGEGVGITWSANAMLRCVRHHRDAGDLQIFAAHQFEDATLTGVNGKKLSYPIIALDFPGTASPTV